MTQIPEADLKEIVTPVSKETSWKVQTANHIFIATKRDLKTRGDDWERELTIRSDNRALRLAIGSAISRLPLITRLQDGFRLGRLAEAAIDSPKTWKLNLTDEDRGIIDRAAAYKKRLFGDAIQSITGIIAKRVMFNSGRNIDVFYEHGLIPGSLVVKISDVLGQVDEPDVYKVGGKREKSASLVKTPTILLGNRGRGQGEIYQPVINKPLGFLTEKAARPIIVESRLLAVQSLPYFIQAFQENSPMYKKK